MMTSRTRSPARRTPVEPAVPAAEPSPEPLPAAPLPAAELSPGC